MVNVAIAIQAAGTRAKDALEIANVASGMVQAVNHHNKLGAPITDSGAQQAALLNCQVLDTADDYLESAHHRLMQAVEQLEEARTALQAKRKEARANFQAIHNA